MNENDTCPICLADYTTSDTHRPASMKCGHLFGYLCLKNWFNTARTALCPTCSKPSKASEIRIIFASSVKCIDSEKENLIMNKYLEEKRRTEVLTNENAQLKISMGMLQMEVQKLEKTIVDMTVFDFGNQSEVPLFTIFKELKICTNYSIVLVDKANNNVFISFRDKKTVGYIKLGYNYDKLVYVSLFDRVPDFSFVSEMKMSSFNDSLILMCYNTTVKLINSITENVIVSIECDNHIKTACFGRTNMDCIYIGDVKGYLFVYSLKTLEFTSKLRIDDPIHSIQLVNSTLFISSRRKWYIVRDKREPMEIEDLNLNNSSNCIYLYGHGNFLFVTIRQGICKAAHKIYEVTDDVIEVKAITNIKQFSKYRNKVFENKIFIVDENQNGIFMVFIDQKKRHLIYKGKDKIIDFDITEDTLIILELNNLFILKKDKI